jgi:predicted transglutaminase-like cysteine proteinase
MQQAVFGAISTRLRNRALRCSAIIGIAAAQFVSHSFLEESSIHAQTVAFIPAAKQPILAGGKAKPTAGWMKFCEKLPAECEINPAEPETITLTSDVWHTLVSVNKQVNAKVKPRTDKAHWGVEDRWDYPDDGYGDCEDYQILKRKRLVEEGLPHRAMRMTVVIDEEGLGHAVMMVRTDRGDFILDNKRNAVLPWSQTGYVYIKREGSTGSEWAYLGGRISPTATANQ